MKTRTILLTALLATALAALVAHRMYDAKPATAADRSAELNVKAATLYAEFQQDEVSAGEQYNDKVVEVEGVVRDVTAGTDKTTDVLLETGDPLGAVVCEFNANETIGLKKGDPARIKGFCAGYNLDVLLQRCTLSK